MHRCVLVLIALGVAGCRPGEAAPIDDHDHPAVVAAVKAMSMGETAHLLTTDRRPGTAADSLRGDELVVAIRDALGKYATLDRAVKEGFRELPDGDTSERAIVHFFNWRNALEEAVRFNPAKPAALIYRRGRNGYRLLGATYTAPGVSTEEALDQRVPLSVAQWHQHVDLCVPKPGDTARWPEVGPDGKPVFGPESAIDTQAGCDSVAGEFKNRVFGWMVEARVFVSDNPDSIWGSPSATTQAPAPVPIADTTTAKAEAPKVEPPKPAPSKPEPSKPEPPKAQAPKASTEKGTLMSDGVPVGWERFAPVTKSHGPHPAVILLPAGDSIVPEAAKQLASRGYVVEILQYADVGGDQRADFGKWIRTVGDAITQLSAAPGVDSTKIGLIGVRAGAALALHRAQMDKRVKAVVEYFGVYRVRDPAYAAKLPPVLIVGNEAEAQRLDGLLTTYHVPHEMEQAGGHVIDFLKRYLPPG